MRLRCDDDALRRRRALAMLLALAAAPWLASCGSKPPPPPPPPKPPPPPPKLDVSILAAPRLNPDSNGRNSPVVVRVYELKSAARFASADFMSLFQQDSSALGPDVIARDEFVLQPDGLKSINRLLSPETQALGVMAAFRDLDRAKWRTVIDLAPGRDNSVTVELDELDVKASLGRP